MIGSISKVRPAGHHHYYKYAHVESNTSKVAGNTNNRFYFIERDYVKDIYNDNCWGPFSLHNAKTITSCSFEDGRFTKFKAHTPNLQNANGMFTADNGITSPAVVDFQINYDKLTSLNSLFYGFDLTKLPDDFNPITRYFYFLFGGGCANSIATAHGGTFPYYEIINQATNTQFLFRSPAAYIDDNYTFENTTNAGGMFYSDGYWDCVKRCPKNLSLKNTTSIERAFNNCNASTFTQFQTKDEMSKLTTASYAFHGCTYLTSLYPDYESFNLPKLSTAAGMFNNCKLDKPSIIKLSDALPDWSSNTATHNITIGCHIDHKYDPEVNVALKKLNHNYVTPIEEVGSTLPQSITSSKNWTLTIQWNGTATSNAYPAP